MHVPHARYYFVRAVGLTVIFSAALSFCVGILTAVAQTACFSGVWTGPPGAPPTTNRTKPVYQTCTGIQDIDSNLDIDATDTSAAGVDITYSGDLAQPALQVALTQVQVGSVPAVALFDNTSGDASYITVQDVDSGDNPEIRLQYDVNSPDHWALYVSKPSNDFRLWNNAANRLTVTQDGRVGIGINNDSPAGLLHIATSTANSSLADGIVFGDGDTGFFESTDDTISLINEGDEKWQWSKAWIRSGNSSGLALRSGNYVAGAPIYTFRGENENTGVGLAARDTLQFTTDGIEAMRITDEGLVGVGNSDPQEALSVSSSTMSTLQEYDLFSIGDDTLANRRAVFSYYVANSDNASYLGIRGKANGGSHLVIQGDGDVGVGTASPQAKLAIEGDILINDGTAQANYVLTSVDASGVAQWRDIAAIPGSGYWTQSGSDLYANNTIWEVGIGNSAPQDKLHVTGDVRIENGALAIDDGTNVMNVLAQFGTFNGGHNIQLQSGATFVLGSGEGASNLVSRSLVSDGTENLHIASDQDISFWTNVQVVGSETELLFLSRNGVIGINDTSPDVSYDLNIAGDAIAAKWDTSSDIRLKKNITPLYNVLDALQNINGVRFDWRTEEYPDRGFDEDRQIGLIAQEVEAFFPELVTTGDEGYKSVAYDQMVPILLEAIKEQQGQIADLQAQIDELRKNQK